MATGPSQAQKGAPAPDAHVALLQRVLWSRHIEKSTRVRDFLAYVCERAFEDPSAEIHEQEVGCRAFSRAVDYDTVADNIVRVTASQARKKLELYFAAEGAAEPVILEIPRGRYTPVFRERFQPPAAPETAPPETATRRLPRHRRAILILACCAPVFAATTLWCAWKLRTATRSELDSSPSLHALWSQLLPREGTTDIVLPDSSLNLFQQLLGRQLTLAEYLKPDLWAQASQVSSNPELQAFAQHAAERPFTRLGSVNIAYRIAQLAGGRSHISIRSARDFSIRQMKSDNVILLGSIRANPWVELIADRMSFRFGADQKSVNSYFDNLAPRSGERARYPADSTVSYCHVAFLPNLTRTGNILAIAGTEVEGTEGGGEFVTSERSLGELRNLARPGIDDRLPYFEVLLKSTRVGGATPGFHILAFRSLRP
jgi:hypothetical protein